MKQTDRRLYALHAQVCQTLSNPKRLEIIQRLRWGEAAVGDLARRMGIAVPNLSQHLALMRARGILTTRQDGRRVWYRLADPEMLQAYDILRGVLLRHLRATARLTR